MPQFFLNHISVPTICWRILNEQYYIIFAATLDTHFLITFVVSSKVLTGLAGCDIAWTVNGCGLTGLEKFYFLITVMEICSIIIFGPF